MKATGKGSAARKGPEKPYRQALREAGGKTYDGLKLSPFRVFVIGVDTTHGPEHPDYRLDAVILARTRAYDPPTVANYKANGRILPIIVALEHVEPDDERWPEAVRGTPVYVVRAGRKGTLYLRESNKSLVAEGRLGNRDARLLKATIHEGRDAKSALQVAAAENLFREEMSPLDVGLWVSQCRNQGLDWDEIERQSRRYKHSQLQRFAVLAEQGIPELHEALLATRLRVSDACKLAALGHKEQRAALERLAGRDKPASGQEVAEALAAANGAPRPIKPPSRRLVERAAVRIADSAGQAWTARERELLDVLAGKRGLDEASQEIRDLFA